MQDKKIIGIAGLARSGKNTVADIITDDVHALQIAFADQIKNMLRSGLGISLADLHIGDKNIVSPVYGVTVRHMMQTLGTDWGRKYIGEDVWVKALERDVMTSFSTSFIVTDVRYENEAEWVRKHGKLIHVVGRGGIPGDHSSESGVVKLDEDLVLDNSGDLDYLRNQIKELASGNYL